MIGLQFSNNNTSLKSVKSEKKKTTQSVNNKKTTQSVNQNITSDSNNNDNCNFLLQHDMN